MSSVFFYYVLKILIKHGYAHESKNYRKTCAMSLIHNSKKITAIVLIYVLLFIMQLHSIFYSDLFIYVLMFIFYENCLYLTQTYFFPL